MRSAPQAKGKCLFCKQHGLTLFPFLHPEHIHDPVDALLHVYLVEGHFQLLQNVLYGLLDSPATGRTFNVNLPKGT